MIPLRYITPQDAAALAGTAPAASEAAGIDLCDWDELLRAVQARLRLIANPPDAPQGTVPGPLHDQIMECADALDLFHRRTKNAPRPQVPGSCAPAPLDTSAINLRWTATFGDLAP